MLHKLADFLKKVCFPSLLLLSLFLWFETAIFILLLLTVSVSKKFGKIQLRVLYEVAVSNVELRQCMLEPLGTGSSRNVGPVFSGSSECLHLDSTCGLVLQHGVLRAVGLLM